MAILVSALMFMINLFTGMGRIWFHWPVLGIMFTVIAASLLRRDRAERGEGRRPQ
jgi:adenylate cyclase